MVERSIGKTKWNFYFTCENKPLTIDSVTWIGLGFDSQMDLPKWIWTRHIVRTSNTCIEEDHETPTQKGLSSWKATFSNRKCYLSMRVQIFLWTPSVSIFLSVFQGMAFSYSERLCASSAGKMFSTQTIYGWNYLRTLMETVFQGYTKIALTVKLGYETSRSRNFLAVSPKATDIILATFETPISPALNPPPS